jgi:FdhE protein
MTMNHSLATAPETGTADAAPFLRLPNVTALYARRAARLRKLAQGHGMASYLRCVANIAAAQHKAAASLPPPAAPDPAILQRSLDCGAPPYSRNRLRLDPAWHMRLNTIIKAFKETQAPEPAREALICLGSMSFAAREKLAHRFLLGEIADENLAKAMFVAAALGVYWAGMTRGVRLSQVQKPAAGFVGVCPICGSPPVGSVLESGPDGVRYLHCSLCDAEWRYTPARCASCRSAKNCQSSKNCQPARRLAYLGFERDLGPVRAECCGECGTYLKALNLAEVPDCDVLADDLATLDLDYNLAGEGLQRYGYNPFLLKR